MSCRIWELLSVKLKRFSDLELVTLISVITTLAIVYATFDYLRAVILCFKLKGPPARLLVGCVLMFMDKMMLEKYFKTVEQSYGRIFRFWSVIFPVFVVTNPEDLQTVLSSRKHTEKMHYYKLLHNFLGNGLITSTVEEWSVHRRLIQPIFHINTLEQFLGTFIDASNVFVQRLKAGPSQVNIAHLVNQCALDVLNESVLGIPILVNNNIDVDNSLDSPFRQGGAPAGQIRMAKPWLRLSWIYKLTDIASSEMEQRQKRADFIRMIIDKRRAAAKTGEVSKCKCLLDSMLELSDQNPDFTVDDIVNEASTFMLAGQDSVGAATAFCLFLLAQHPDHQQKCVDELNEIYGDYDDGGVIRVPTMRDIQKMRYLEQCIKETLRLYPSVPLLARKIAEEIKCGDHTIPSGSSILMSPYATHRLPSIYENPECFDPERFSPEQCENRHPYAFIPFSAGPRNCIGYKFAYIEIKTIISTILREFELLPVPGKTEITPIFRVTVRSSGGLPIELKPRQHLKHQ